MRNSFRDEQSMLSWAKLFCFRSSVNGHIPILWCQCLLDLALHGWDVTHGKTGRCCPTWKHRISCIKKALNWLFPQRDLNSLFCMKRASGCRVYSLSQSSYFSLLISSSSWHGRNSFHGSAVVSTGNKHHHV